MTTAIIEVRDGFNYSRTAEIDENSKRVDFESCAYAEHDAAHGGNVMVVNTINRKSVHIFPGQSVEVVLYGMVLKIDHQGLEPRRIVFLE